MKIFLFSYLVNQHLAVWVQTILVTVINYSVPMQLRFLSIRLINFPAFIISCTINLNFFGIFFINSFFSFALFHSRNFFIIFILIHKAYYCTVKKDICLITFPNRSPLYYSFRKDLTLILKKYCYTKILTLFLPTT